MTALVGIYCKNGIVVASDSALTINGMIEQNYSKKLVVDSTNNLITAFSCSDLGFAQRYRNKLSKKWSTLPRDIDEKINELSAIGLQEFYETHFPQHKLDVPISFLIGFVHQDKHYLVGLPEGDFQPISYDTDHWYCTLGSGAEIITPFIGFIRKIYWKDEPPTVAQAIFHAYICLKLAVEINAGGVNGEIHIGIIEKDEKTGQYNAKKQDENDMAYNDQMHDAAIDYFANFSKDFEEQKNAKPIPQPTQPIKTSKKV